MTDVILSTKAQLSKKRSSLFGVKLLGWEQQDWERDYNFVQENELTEGASRGVC